MKLPIFVFLMIVSHSSCTENVNLGNEDEAYEVINYYLSRDTPPCLCNNYPLVNREIDVYEIGGEDSIVLSAVLSGAEISYLIEQNERTRSFLIDRNRISSRHVISIDSLKTMRNQKKLWDFFKKNYNADGFSTISYPLFSIDKLSAVIKVESYSETGGAGALYLLRKNLNKWDIEEQLQMWED